MPDIPRAHRRRAVPGRPGRRLLVHEAPVRRVSAEITVGTLDPHEVIRNAPSAGGELPIVGPHRRFRRGIQPLAGVPAIPAALPVVRPMRRVEGRDGCARLVGDEVLQPPFVIRGERLAQQSTELHAAHGFNPNAWMRSVPTNTVPRANAGSLYLPLVCRMPGALFHSSFSDWASKAYSTGRGAPAPASKALRRAFSSSTHTMASRDPLLVTTGEPGFSSTTVRSSWSMRRYAGLPGAATTSRRASDGATGD